MCGGKYDPRMATVKETAKVEIVPQPQANLASLAHWSYLISWVVSIRKPDHSHRAAEYDREDRCLRQEECH